MHINYRRKNPRPCGKRWYTAIGCWNRLANRYYRAATSNQLQRLRNAGFDLEIAEDLVWYVQEEADDYWYYD